MEAVGSRISGVGSCVPERVVFNSDFEKIVDTSDEWIVERTGIRERRIAPDDVATSHLASSAAERALAYAGRSADDVDLIIVATVTPDMFFPSTACLVQRNLKATRAAAFDVNAACSGFVYGVSIASSLISAGVYRLALVIGAETLSRVTDMQDRATCVLFGDGAGAVVIEPSKPANGHSPRGLLSSCLGADGTGWEAITLPAGGSLRPASHETVESRLHYIRMNGNQVFKFAVRAMETAVMGCLGKCNLTCDDVNLLIPHQANLRIITAAAARLNVPLDRVAINVDRFGNMSSATVPVALDEAVRMGRLREGDVGVMVAFGSGLTWGSVAFRW